MVAIETVAISIFSHHRCSSSETRSCRKPPSSSVKFYKPNSISALIHNFPALSLNCAARKLGFLLCSTAQEVAAETEPEKTQIPNVKRKVFVLNLPWSFSVADIKSMFGQCGTVTDVEIIKQKNGKSRGFAFITMASGEEAQAVIDKFDSQDVSGRIIKVEFAKRLRKPSPQPPSGVRPGEAIHKLYVSNLAWKARSSHLREFFSANFSPVSARVVFEASGRGKAAGYGFVSFATKEEAEAAISALDGKELMGRPIHLKFSETKDGESGVSKEEKEDISDIQSEAL
ncbi:hypothetical protein SLEP1_g9083 [Rubroshorea leprosula]|uniref:RRM domain-containing protein n=1 Tax=Rubroshorea leprosula TaxID=152421 RepID=A0AAV5ID29_9ROSI|nr:hypothetical protein SLEP1_g9083 [Rubroshorea leprosula]